ncbi:T9SS type A sorting domain-containing protein [Flavisolibacter sp. BT320]|nr:T9SS type A sorting domain-containing protein [Flavisolibacter longurius]
MRLFGYGFALILFLLIVSFCQAQKWEALNPPLNMFNDAIEATHFNASGTLYAGGLFRNSNGQCFVARWQNGSWAELGVGASTLKANGAVITLASFRDTLYAAGAFTNAAGKYYVAKWDGAAWTEVGTLNANSFIYALTTDKQGNLYAAGAFTNAADKNYVAKWNGITWNEMGSGANALHANATIYALAADSAGNVYTGGQFTNAAGKQYVAKWNGTSWNEAGSGANALNANAYIRCLATGKDGMVYAGGGFRNTQKECYLARWNGTTWTEVGSGTQALQANDAINSIAMRDNGEIYVAGIFTNSIGGYYIAKWNGTAWTELNNPRSPLLSFNRVHCLAVDSRGNLAAGGDFKNKSGHRFVGYWDGMGWSELGGKGDPFYSGSWGIRQIIGDAVGNVYVAGGFHDAGGYYYLQYWNGKGWKELVPPDTSGLYLLDVHTMAVDSKGALYVPGRKSGTAGSYAGLLKWDGNRWTMLETTPNTLGLDNTVPGAGIGSIVIDKNDKVYIGGLFKDQQQHLFTHAMWDGQSWGWFQNLGSAGMFHVDGNGSFIALRENDGQVAVMRYQPATSTWTAIGNSGNLLRPNRFNYIYSLSLDAQNNMYVHGDFVNAAGMRYIAKWNGTTWQEIAHAASMGPVLAVDSAGALYVNNMNHLQSGDPVRKWNGSTWVGLGLPPPNDWSQTGGQALGTDRAGNLYIAAPSGLPGVGDYIAKYTVAPSLQPALQSFTPASGSVGTKVTLRGKNLLGTRVVRFGGTPAASFAVQNDSTVTAVVANGASGTIEVETTGGVDSIKTFVFTCDSVNAPVPYLFLQQDTVLVSSSANHYRWFYNNQAVANERTNRLRLRGTGWYRVETSTDTVCWVPSLDYPLLVNPASLSDSLTTMLYPNPSTGRFTVYVKLPQATTVKTFVQVLDANGNQVLQTSRLVFFGNEIRIPVTLTSKGTYFVKIVVNDRSAQQTIIIL